MNPLTVDAPGREVLLMGNEAIARGAIEAGVRVCAAYPGNPSSDIIQALARVGPEMGLHVEWSVNEKVALEVAAAASLAGLKGLTAMKQNGLNVASDFLLNLNLTGSRAGLAVVVCDDPGGISSTNEEDSRPFAKMADLPLLEPASFQEAKDMVRAALELSEELELPCLVHSVTRVSHARGNVRLGPLAQDRPRARFDRQRHYLSVPGPARYHAALKAKLERCRQKFETWSFNSYQGPEEPELLIVSAGAGLMYCREALLTLGLTDRVGLVKLGATWPLPEQFLLEHLARAERILFVEEGDAFLEGNVKELCAQQGRRLGIKTFLGQASGDLPQVGELTPDLVIEALARLLDLSYQPRPPAYAEAARQAAAESAPNRDLGFCPGCPHRATYWAIKQALALDARDGFVLGDIGCYSLAFGPAGFYQMDTMMAMGSGAGLASGMGQLQDFGLDQPIIAVCGDSTFFHAAIPALINARHQGAGFLLLVLDNSATAMTGFQPHPGLNRTATGEYGPEVNIEGLCQSLGLKTSLQDPYDLKATVRVIQDLLQEEGVRILILRRECALIRARRGPAEFQVRVDQAACLGQECGCNRLCTRVFKCPGLVWDPATGKARIDEALCTGCGVCAQICPAGAIITEAV